METDRFLIQEISFNSLVIGVWLEDNLSSTILNLQYKVKSYHCRLMTIMALKQAKHLLTCWSILGKAVWVNEGEEKKKGGQDY